MTVTLMERAEVVESEGLTLSVIVWRLFKRKPLGYVERVLDRNPGLAELGPYIPVGTKIILPLDQRTSTPIREVVRLWD